MSSNIRPMKVEIHSISREFDRFFKIDQYDTSHEGYDGKIYRNKWLVFERGDAVAVVLYRKDTHEIVLVRQFRAPTLRPLQSNGKISWQGDGQLDEVIAGMPRPGESHEDCAIREVFEETRYRVAPDKLEKIASFYVSPGGTSERIFLFYAEVTAADQAPPPAGDASSAGNSAEHESTLVRHVPVFEFIKQMTEPKLTIDSKLLIASMLLREKLHGKVRAPGALTADFPAHRFVLASKPEFSIVLRAGNMFEIKDVDAWINSENTHMEMDRLIGSSVSARIRYAGAAKNADGRVIEDTIADALRKCMRGRYESEIGTVHDTTSGSLQEDNNVKRIFHVASVKGLIGKGTPADLKELCSVVRKALSAVERRNGRWGTSRCASALLPMIGTGDGGLKTEQAFPEIVKGALELFAQGKPRILRAVHISAYSRDDADFALRWLQKHDELRQES